MNWCLQKIRFIDSASCINAFRSSMNAPPSMYFFVKILYHYENIVQILQMAV